MLFWRLKELDSERKFQLVVLGISLGVHSLFILLISLAARNTRVFDLTLFAYQRHAGGARVSVSRSIQKHAHRRTGTHAATKKQDLQVMKKAAIPAVTKPVSRSKNRFKKSVPAKIPVKKVAQPLLKKQATKKPEIAKADVEPKVNYSKLPKAAPKKETPKPVEQKIVVKEESVIKDKPVEKVVEKPLEKSTTEQTHELPTSGENLNVVISFRINEPVNGLSTELVDWQVSMQNEMIKLLDMPRGFEGHAPLLVNVSINSEGKPTIVGSSGCTIPVVVASAQALLLKYNYPKLAWGSNRDFLF